MGNSRRHSAFFAAKADRNPGRANNWMARRLLIRAVAATVAGLTPLRAQLPGQLSEFTARNYIAGPSGRPDGRTFGRHLRRAAAAGAVALTLAA